MFDWKQDPHRRLNPLTREWVLVSPHRTARPWQGQIEEAGSGTQPDYDPECYLCPGNERAGGIRNPEYTSTFVFDNDFPALLPSAEGIPWNEQGILVAAPERGVSRVVCFSPRHDLSIPAMDLDALARVVDTWAEQLGELRALPFIRYVQIFENRGAMMGASNPHPHGQIWASENIPNEICKEDLKQLEYWTIRRSCLLCDYLRL